MTESHIWSMDRIAAANLLNSIGVEDGGEKAEQVAGHFARHRRVACQWAAERVHANILQGLESTSLDLLADRDDRWADGFHRAEQVVMTMQTEDLLGIDPRAERTKGQFLRTMVRSARRESAGR